MRALIALALLGLSACVQPPITTTTQAPATTALEAKIERLEASIEVLIHDRKEQIEQAARYRACAARCSELADKITDDFQKQTTKEENLEIRGCWKECEKDQPLEVIGC